MKPEKHITAGNSLNLKQELINPKGTEAIYQMLQFSQAVKTGNMLWVSGQVGVDDSFEIADGIEAQSRKAFENLQRVIEEAGGTLKDIVELVTYHTSMSDMKTFSDVKSEFIPDNFPAWTAVGVTELVLHGLMIEIKATVVIGSGQSN